MKGLGPSLVVWLVLLPASALACSVCGFGMDKTRWAFLATTGLLTVLPLGMFLVAFLYVRHRLRLQRN